MRKDSTPVPQGKLSDFCRRWQVRELALFGVATDEGAAPGDGVGVLVTFAPEAPHDLFALAEMQAELGKVLGREVALVERAGLRNPFRRQHILASRVVIYAA